MSVKKINMEVVEILIFQKIKKNPRRQKTKTKTIKKLAIRKEKSGPEVNTATSSEAQFGGKD